VAGVSGSDIWVGDINRGTTTRLTHGGTNVAPVWNGQGSAVYYATASSGPFEIWTRDSSGSSPAHQVLSAARRHKHVFPSSVSRDGRLLAYTESGGLTRGDVKVIDTATAAPVAAVESPFDEANGALSPDGRLLAYQSDESGRWEISLLKLDEQRRIPISSSGGRAPLWSSSGNALFYTAGDTLMRVAINTRGEPAGAPISIAAPSGGSLTGIVAGDRILLRGAEEQPSARAVLTLEWSRDLSRILGPLASPLPQ
jgi:Tol biopolymer transport system component